MAYNASQGPRELGDIKNEDDPDTQVDFSSDQIALKTGGVDRITVTNSHVSSSVNLSASAFYGDGSNLSGIDAAVITTYNTAGDNRVITSVNSSTVQGETKLTFDGNVLLVNASISGSGNISGSSIFVENDISHTGDPDTKITFGTDTITLTAGNENLLTLTEGSQDVVTVGDGGDVDFAVKTNNHTDTIFVQGDNDKVGIRTSSPLAVLHITGSGIITGSSVQEELFRVDGDAGLGKLFVSGSGNVGIGTLTPAKTLTVVGQISASLGVTGSRLQTANTFIDDLHISSSLNISGASFHGNEIHVGSHIYHKGDQNTFINLTADDINIQAGGVNFIDITQDTTNEITFNEEAADINFRVEGNSDANLLFTDGGTNKVGIGVVPNHKLTVAGDISASINVSASAFYGNGANLTNVPASPAGNNMNVQFNDDGDLAGSNNFAFDGSKVAVVGQISASLGVSGSTLHINDRAIISGSLRAKQIFTTYSAWQTTSTSKYFVPFYNVTETSTPNHQTILVKPFSGKLVAAIWRPQSSQGGNNCVLGLHITGSGQEAPGTGYDSETVTVTQDGAFTPVTFVLTGSQHFTAGQVVAISIDPHQNAGEQNLTCIWEYDVFGMGV